MPSERTILENNTNNSKNTRMDISKSFDNFDIRKDEIMHIARYFRAIAEIQSLAKQLGRPIKVLELGCGECYTMQLFYKAIIEKKSNFISSFIGVDIDGPMVERVRKARANMLAVVNGKLVVQDLTTDPKLKVKDGRFDLVICFEMLEHIQPNFVPAILKEINRVLVSETGVALISTPNSTGASTDKLPKDHIYEWGYEELCKRVNKHLFLVSTHGIGVNLSKVPAEDKKRLKGQLEALEGSYGKGTYFTSTVLAAFCGPEYCKNVLYVCNKLE